MSENRIESDEINFNMEGHSTPTKSEAEGTFLFISESLKSSRRTDLETYLFNDKLPESTFSVNNNSMIAGAFLQTSV